jgi:hypothetical protein
MAAEQEANEQEAGEPIIADFYDSMQKLIAMPVQLVLAEGDNSKERSDALRIITHGAHKNPAERQGVMDMIVVWITEADGNLSLLLISETCSFLASHKEVWWTPVMDCLNENKSLMTNAEITGLWQAMARLSTVHDGAREFLKGNLATLLEHRNGAGMRSMSILAHITKWPRDHISPSLGIIVRQLFLEASSQHYRMLPQAPNAIFSILLSSALLIPQDMYDHLRRLHLDKILSKTTPEFHKAFCRFAIAWCG